jgi:hypothetical protein
MKIHVLARAPHLADHLDAIWLRLPDQLRGSRIVDPHGHAPKFWSHDDVVMVASYPDIFTADRYRVIYVEHGAGQSYVNADEMGAANYYHGGQHPECVIAYIGPRQQVIDSWSRPGFAAGAPICDPYQLFSPERVAAITFHYNPPAARVVPEIGTAFEHYRERLGDVIAALRQQGYQVLGHRHPRFNHLRGYWEREHHIREVSAHELRTRAQLLIADNTSMMYEMMYLGRDVIALNAPWYRRDVEHGMRFWSHAPSIQADDPAELIDVVSDLDKILLERSGLDWRTTDYVYGTSHSDGYDGLRAATWLTTFVSGL